MGALKDALSNGVAPPSTYRLPHRQEISTPVYSIPDDLFDIPAIRAARRANRFGKMAMLAAADCLESSLPPPLDRVGIVLATGLGPHASNMEFSGGLIQYGLDQGSPTHFSHSVHNSAAAYVSNMLKTHGPATTITHFQSAVGQALQVAKAWLDSGRVDYVLLGAVDEIGELMLYIFHEGQLIDKTDRIPGEGSAFLLLSRSGPASSRLASIQPMRSGVEADLCLVDDSSIIPLPTPHQTQAVATGASYSHLWGKMPTGYIFSLACAALKLTPEVQKVLCVDKSSAIPAMLLER
ncbi:MAG: hypothetical protein A2X46_17825 [Lentisphaerae bacterium GWF2_57_35]|nr:MAG: hypothetical protein A2X46_17825 [Lentisphaerae bacterium GWF2_57_35]